MTKDTGMLQADMADKLTVVACIIPIKAHVISESLHFTFQRSAQ